MDSIHGSMLRQAQHHHERNQQLAVRPEPVEGLVQCFLKNHFMSAMAPPNVMQQVTQSAYTPDIAKHDSMNLPPYVRCHTEHPGQMMILVAENMGGNRIGRIYRKEKPNRNFRS